MTTHCDLYGVGHPVNAAGELVIPAGQEFIKTEPSERGLAIEAAYPGTYWPYYNGYYWETPPHEDGECEANRPTSRWVREADLAPGVTDVHSVGDPE